MNFNRKAGVYIYATFYIQGPLSKHSMKILNFMSKTILIAFFLAFWTFSFCQEKRNAFKLEIVADKEHQYGADIPESPYFVADKVLQIYCGEKLFVECEIKSDTIFEMKVVKENKNPKKTIEIDFYQEAEDRENIITMLSVKNPFDKALLYDALMFTPISQTWKRTSIIPVRPTIYSFETWPHSIISLVLENWRFVE